MKRFIFFLAKNNTFLLYLVCCISHFFWAIGFGLMHSPEFIPMFWWNIADTFIFFFAILSYSRLNKLALFTVFAVELAMYSLFEVLVTKMVCGVEIYVIGLFPATFLFTTQFKRPKFYFTAMNVFYTVCLICIMYWKLTWLPPEKLFAPERKLFFQMSQLFCSTSVLLWLLYACFTTENQIRRITRRSKFIQHELEYTANHDVLTGLMNRCRINEIFKHCTLRKEKEGIDYAVCIFDIDDFKKVNDTYGHDAGDFVLKSYTHAVWQALPEPIRIGRWGGEEFVIIYPEITEETVFELEDIRKRLSSTPIIYNGNPIHVSATFGISSSRCGKTTEEILSDADHHLLDGKEHGKDRIVVSEKF
jgi:diguanylate cyclase (GGDEF)-like protein